jgi:hypothetical protein
MNPSQNPSISHDQPLLVAILSYISVCDYIRDLDWMTTYAARLGATSSYSATASNQNSQITTAPAKSFPACCVFTSRSLATASNSRDSSASSTHVIPSPTLIQNCLRAIPWTEQGRSLFSACLEGLNCTQHSPSRLNCQLSVPFRTTLYAPNIKHRFQQYLYYFLRIRCRGKVFIEPLPSKGRLLWLHYSGCRCHVTILRGDVVKLSLC